MLFESRGPTHLLPFVGAVEGVIGRETTYDRRIPDVLMHRRIVETGGAEHASGSKNRTSGLAAIRVSCQDFMATCGRRRHQNRMNASFST